MTQTSANTPPKRDIKGRREEYRISDGEVNNSAPAPKGRKLSEQDQAQANTEYMAWRLDLA